ncbi:Thiamine pathway transporter THI73 [Candida tropicalis]
MSEKISISLSNKSVSDDSEFDNALPFVKENIHNDDTPDEQPEDSRKVTRKLDLIILPLLCGIYFFQFLDKSLLNYAAAMGIKKHLVGNEFANLSTIFYASYIFGEPIASYMLQRFPLGKTLGVYIICWGVVVTCHSACSTYAELMIVRSLLGLFEASSAAGIITVTSIFYTKPQQAARMGIWSVMAGTATMVGALLSFGFQHIKTTRFTSWQILFLVIGLITIAFGIFVCFYLPDNIHTAWFLNKEDKVYLLNNVVKKNQTGTKSSKFKWKHIKELLFGDKFTWLYFLLTITSQIVTGAIGTFSVTITLTFGFDSYQSALLQLPIGFLIIVIILTATQLVARFGHITMISISMFVPTIVGAIVLIISPNRIGNILALYLLYSGSSVITLIYAWVSANTAGTSKKIFRSGMTMIAFSVACIIGPQLFQAYSAPHYHPAKIVILITQCLCIPICMVIGWLCKKENEKRDQLNIEMPENFEFLDLTDVENKEFRYIY